MEPLSRKEEQILNLLYRLEKAFVKEIIAELPGERKPAYNTVSTLIRRLVKKGYVTYEEFGTTHRYYPIISREEYRKKGLTKVIDNFFDSSYKSVVAHFAREQKLSKDDLKDIIRLIEEE